MVFNGPFSSLISGVEVPIQPGAVMASVRRAKDPAVQAAAPVVADRVVVADAAAVVAIPMAGAVASRTFSDPLRPAAATT